MRVFNRYSPKLVAKHVTRLFSGRLYIAGRGRFDFNNGWLSAPDHATICHYQTVKEVNGLIRDVYQEGLREPEQSGSLRTTY
ncbi:hypothetical protein BZG72_08030 [Salinivibrio sp. PR6]|uniref:DUF1107 domain-containing protein n=1 Tax=unclassified Salinivibrio TaxID=2636825 RepID=UPI0009889227|nr:MULTISPECIES: DUF1107 domain-containing protein [unclassified Salinivibrio]OOE76484.1 hypothetical protein BZG23_03325 [Salinivibrio sp. ML290]OOE82933.1 hypothetical protein BZG72_08030 [Salinivibrio sp. PR6]